MDPAKKAMARLSRGRMSKFSVPLDNPKKAAPDMTTDIMSGVELAKGGKKGEPTEEGMSGHLDQLNRYQASSQTRSTS